MTAPRAMTPEDLTRIRFPSEPRLSPDGSRVAFVVTTLSEERDEYLSQIWVVPAGGGEPRRFTTGPKRDTSPVWSPDGTRLAFVARVGGWQEPDDEEERAKSKPARVIDVLKYRSNGVGFVYDRPRHLFVVPVDGGEPRQLTSGDGDDRDPAWSPDGRALAFASARHDGRDVDLAADIWLVSADGGEPRRVTATAGPAASPAVSPDGRTIAYLGHAYARDVSRNVRVYAVPAAGGAARCLTEALDRNCEPLFGAVPPTWLGGSDAVLFAAEDQGDLSLLRVAASGLDGPKAVVSGTRQVRDVSVSRDGTRIAFVATDPVSPGEVLSCRSDGSGERPLTDLNRAWRDEVALSRPERFRFERDGFRIDGWVMRPFGFEPGRRYPALVNVHGGPASQYGHGFFDEFQVYAGAGYAVVYVNPRGSQGYGEAFARAVVGDWGGGDYADIMAGLDEALRRYDFIDPDRLGVMGGSYGGFMTSWIVGHTDRFKAACSERAVNALWSMFGTSDIGHYFQELHSGGPPPWDDLRWYLERSPLSYAKEIRTPLLIIHSEDDLRCPTEQAEQLFVALKRLQRTVRFVRFPDEDHDLSRTGRPRHRLARFRIILDWFGEHLEP